MNKKILVIALIVAGVLVANQAEAANFFQKMFKRGPVASSTPVKGGSNWDSACIVKAIEKREASIGAAYGEMTDKISAALTVRAKSLSASWAQVERGVRSTSRNTAWKTFNDTSKVAREVHKTAVKGAWASYKADAGVCRVDVEGVEPEDKEADL